MTHATFVSAAKIAEQRVAGMLANPAGNDPKLIAAAMGVQHKLAEAAASVANADTPAENVDTPEDPK